jgi:hypothetical protein
MARTKSFRGEWSSTAPVGDDDVVVIPLADFALTGAARATDAGHIGVAFDGAAEESALVTVPIPAHWLTFDVKIVQANPVAGTGNVMWRVNHKDLVVGALVAVTAGTDVVAASGAQDTSSEVTLASGLTAPTAAALNLKVIEIQRDGADALDTKDASDQHLLAVRLIRAS